MSSTKNGAKLDALRMEFANWLITPERTPATQGEWASEHGVAEQTLSVWKNAPDVKAVLEVPISSRDQVPLHFVVPLVTVADRLDTSS
jgi:hypothetical protein